MREFFVFERAVFDALPKEERSNYHALLGALLIPDGQPFFLGEDGLPVRDLDGFCNYLMDPCRWSRNTWATYAGQVAVFLRYLDAQCLDWKDVCLEDIKNYFKVRTTGQFQHGKVLKAQSWNVAKTAIVHLYEYALEANLIQKVPFKYRKSKALFGYRSEMTADLDAKSTPEPINFIGIRQYKSIWRPCLAKRDNAQRNLALSDLLITVGLRISEALSLQAHQIPDPEAAQYAGRKSVQLRVVGKGKKPRMVRVPKRVLRAIHFYIEEDREQAVQTYLKKKKTKAAPTQLFLSRNGTPLSARSVQNLFGTVSKLTDIRLTPHGCRHTFAVYQLEAMVKRMAKNLKELRSGGIDAYHQVMNDPLRQLQLLLGHSHISSTYIYLDFLEESEALVDESMADWTDWESGRGE